MTREEEQQTAAAADIERIDLTRQAMAAVALAPPIAVTSVSGVRGHRSEDLGLRF